ncbi:MAG: GNAT family N-acetyltransferase [Pseudolysinimonas sp.]
MRAVGWDHPGGVALREAQRVEIRADYYPELENSEPGPPPSAADMTVYYVAFDGDRAVASGGLRQIDSGHGEIKRMFVDVEYRGTGVAAQLLRALEADARERGWDRLVLETGDRMLPAQRFYLREGFTPIPQFGPYVGVDLSLCFGKVLAS